MLELLPKEVPPLETLLDNIGRPRARKVAKALGVSERTVQRWQETGHAPRPVLLALFWITRWGFSIIDCKAHNDAVMYAGMVNGLKRQIADLEERLEAVGRIGDFGSANDPAPGVRSVAQPTPQLTFPPIRFPDEDAEQPAAELGSSAPAKPSSTKQRRGFQRG